MDINDNVDCFSQPSLLFLTFLTNTPCRNQKFQEELRKLGCELKLCTDADVYSGGRVYSHHGLVDSNIECDGELESDGHAPSNPRHFVQDVLPQVHLELPVNAEEAQAVRSVASELIRIADDLNHIIGAQAVEGLTKKLRTTSPQSWQNLLTQTVENLLKDVPGAHTERVTMALTFSLVKAVCERAPVLLRGLFNTLMQNVFPPRSR